MALSSASYIPEKGIDIRGFPIENMPEADPAGPMRVACVGSFRAQLRRLAAGREARDLRTLAGRRSRGQILQLKVLKGYRWVFDGGNGNPTSGCPFRTKADRWPKQRLRGSEAQGVST